MRSLPQKWVWAQELHAACYDDRTLEVFLFLQLMQWINVWHAVRNEPGWHTTWGVGLVVSIGWVWTRKVDSKMCEETLTLQSGIQSQYTCVHKVLIPLRHNAVTPLHDNNSPPSCLHHIQKESEKTGIKKFIPYLNTQIWGIIKFLRFWVSQKQLFNQ